MYTDFKITEYLNSSSKTALTIDVNAILQIASLRLEVSVANSSWPKLGDFDVCLVYPILKCLSPVLIT